mmetsp:Transcript_59146/g.165880  ORF Transcript_59146/g.165880 Transcript_59146/m.165880 type:complete len:464 (+) Transcript_59146:62-1453(+)
MPSAAREYQPVPTLKAQLVAEFLGTFMLTFTVGCNVLLKSAVWGGISIACMLMVAVYGLAGISGAHFNPAVSISLATCRSLGGHGIQLKTAAMYTVVQLLAALAAAGCYTMLCHRHFDLAPAPGFGLWQAGLCEFLYTFMLCFVVLSMPLAANDGPNDFFGLAVGFVMIAGIYGAGAVSGGFFNPAISLGIDAWGDDHGFGWCLMYGIFHVLGGVAAAFVFKVVRNEAFGGLRGGMIAELTSEFIGTYMLVLTLGLNVMGKSPAGAFSVGAALMCMLYALGGVSGGNFNPAITLAVLVSGRSPRGAARKTVIQAGWAVAAQLLGGVLAALTYSAVYLGGSFRLGPGSSGTAGTDAIMGVEFVFTFVLCYVFLAVTLSETTGSPAMCGLAVGSCITVGGVAASSISGGVLNPAAALGIASAHRFAEFGVYSSIVYSVTQLLAGVAAASVFKVTHKVDVETKVEY